MFSYYKIYSKKHVDKLIEKLGPKTIISVPDENDDTYFDGFANVYDVLVSYINDKGNWSEYTTSITHEALAYYCNGDD